MKVRTGFVSNSSSSSFVVVGIQSKRLLDTILAATRLTEEKLWNSHCIDNGQYRVGNIDIIWGDGDTPIIGVDARSRVVKGHTFKRMGKTLLAELEKLGIKPTPSELIGFYFGEVHG